MIILLILSVVIVQGANVEDTTNISSENTTLAESDLPGQKEYFELLIEATKELESMVKRIIESQENNELGVQTKNITKREVSYEGLTPDMYYQMRAAEISSWKNKSQEDHPYPHSFKVTISLEEVVDLCIDFNEGELQDNITLTLAGRIYDVQRPGPKIVYYYLKADNGFVQILVMSNTSVAQLLKRGDIIGVTGHPGKSKLGEVTVVPKHITLLAPSLRQLPYPVQYKTKYDKRYLDLILIDKTKQVFRVKAKIITFIRQFLDNMGFLEVDTPILQPIAQGAKAKPFKTHFDYVNRDSFLRIAPELYHKLLIIGGMNRVYEIGRQFRNEKIDDLHNPEFTTLEFHMANTDYNDLMEITETLMAGMTRSIQGTYEVKYHPDGPQGKEIKVDFTPPYQRLSVLPTLKKTLNITLPPTDKLHTLEANSFLKQLCEKHKLDCGNRQTSGSILERLIDVYISRKIVSPTFVIDYPQIISPLAKEHKTYPGLSERFEFYVLGKKIANAYTEQNDPVEQRKQFALQDLYRKQGDVDIPLTDEQFLAAMEYGMPLTAGLGLHIDRITMILTDSYKIKDVLLFPMTTPEKL